MNLQRNATLEDVARAAGVSTATVSRCLNNPNSVKDATREHVLASVKALGYAPNFGARALAAKKTHIIGAIIPTMENAIFAAGLQAFQEELSAEGYTLLVSSSSYHRQLEEEQIYNLVSRGADGLLLIGEDRDASIYEFLNQRNIPYVLAWNYKPNATHNFVGFDNVEAARSAANEVIARGHKSIGIIAGQTLENDRSRDRKNGFLLALQDANIPIKEVQVTESAYSFEEAGNAFETMLRLAPETTAILCGNDVIAVGALMRAQDLSIDVPGQVSLVGFDDIEIAKLVSPKLSTVHVPHRQMGRHAASLLTGILSQNKHSRSVELKPHFVNRDSLAQR